MNSLRFLATNDRILLHAFVIMPNHLHILWHIKHPHKKEDVQRDFLKYTAQMLLMKLRAGNTELLQSLYVGAKDRKYQVWERNSLTIEVYSSGVLKQKLQYIHNNPVKAGLCKMAEDYFYSSADFYDGGKRWEDLLTAVEY